MIVKLILLALVALVLYLASRGKSAEEMHVKKYDDKVVEFIAGRLMLVDKR